MKQVVILSGKGGTGKTSVSAAFAHLATANGSLLRTVLADADVDAANLEFVLSPNVLEKHDFLGGQVAVIDREICDACGVCQTACRFDSIFETETGYEIDAIACDGCAACVYQCPCEAIHMQSQTAGQWFHAETNYGHLFHAALRPAQENSGKLVTMVKQQARLLAMDEAGDLVIVDGPPGIGCPVISAVSGADLALIVTEPSAAGAHDMRRVLETTAHFGVPATVCINKADIYPKGAAEIQAFCREQGIQIAGEIPFDEAVTQAMVQGQSVTERFPDAPASLAMKRIWSEVLSQLNGRDHG